MKKKFIFLISLIFCIYIIIYPKECVLAAGNGLRLWYERVLPALLPFAILSNIFIFSNYITYINRILLPVVKLLLPVSDHGSFVVLSGYLFGFPMGSKNCAELLKQDKISLAEAEILFAITNNLSPVFINSYILYQQLQMPQLFPWFLLALYLPSILLGNILLRRHAFSKEKHKKMASRSQMNFKIIDASIMNGFETLVRIGGYIMLFSIAITMIEHIPCPIYVKSILIGCTEITNGVQYISASNMTAKYKYIETIFITSLGGLSGLAQTSSMIKDTALSLKKYVILKLILTVFTVLFAFIETLFW